MTMLWRHCPSRDIMQHVESDSTEDPPDQKTHSGLNRSKEDH